MPSVYNAAEPRGQGGEESEEVVIQIKAQRAGKSLGTEVPPSLTYSHGSIRQFTD